MKKMFSYVLRYDDGAAPNPFGGVCTLAICKPAIRRIATKGDWVIGTGSKNSKCNDGLTYDLSNSIVYAMKISKRLSLKNYDSYCQNSLTDKIPIWGSKVWHMRMGDCIYDFSIGSSPRIRRGVHNESNRIRDLSGINVLISDHFYYFGEEARPLPKELFPIIKRNQSHKKIENQELISKFEKWIKKFERNKIHASPQMRMLFEGQSSDQLFSQCARNHCQDDNNQNEEVLL